MKITSGSFKDAIRQAIKDMIGEIISENAIWEEFDRVISEEFEDCRCWISFDENGAEALIGVSKGDADFYAKPEISVEDYGFVDAVWGSHTEDIQNQLAGIDKFILNLQVERESLVCALNARAEYSKATK